METTIADDFVFSQSNLQTYTDCPRRFWLTYIQRLPWPAVEVAPVQETEYVTRLGELFHRAIQRAEAGIAPDLIASQLVDPLDTWFASYQQFRPRDLPQEVVEVESTLSAPFETGYDGQIVRLAAKFDLLAIEPGRRAVIVDWKTSRKRPEATYLRRRLQSQVYPFLLVEASVSAPWGPLTPEQIEMRYWYTVEPDDPIILRYNSSQHEANRQLLQRLIAQILAGSSEADFPKVADTETNRSRLCSYCNYRSRCDRGITAGDLDALIDVDEMNHDLQADLEINLTDVPEIAF